MSYPRPQSVWYKLELVEAPKGAILFGSFCCGATGEGTDEVGFLVLVPSRDIESFEDILLG